jgi:hypothetical protein
MRQQILASLAVVALAALPVSLAAQTPTAGNEATITGQVIDLNCHTTMGASGAGHKQCAQACAKAGVALAILGEDGTVYVPVSSKPADPQNSRLMDFAESKVKVTGTHRFANGLHTIEIKTVTAAT